MTRIAAIEAAIGFAITFFCFSQSILAVIKLSKIQPVFHFWKMIAGGNMYFVIAIVLRIQIHVIASHTNTSKCSYSG
ncbi:hypothetical protein [Sphaerochaeta sp. PS]|uniref:hypothetical protein n=1 Tax=Sphaerochaeta sp. PS TaxID=3076336 RepID=UPI0028A4BB7B|nr:hypothetical protein [Sphaerochaeta sp. PS]MDT4763358.1 hypothetical protein [Sphaerochaeta sp. PS]